MVIVIFIYKVNLEIYAFTGEFASMVTGQELSFATPIYFFPASLVEKTMFRALVFGAILIPLVLFSLYMGWKLPETFISDYFKETTVGNKQKPYFILTLLPLYQLQFSPLG